MSDYPARLSADELSKELDAYLEARRAAGHPPNTVNTDKTKITQFFHWLETGQAQ